MTLRRAQDKPVNWWAFALFCEARRVHRDLTVRALAARCRVSVGQLNRLRSGLPVRHDAMRRICRWVGEPLALFDGGDDG